jgi:hypothetical protein
MSRILTEHESWAIKGGRFDPILLPAWVQTDVIQAVADDFAFLTNRFTRDYHVPVTIGLTNDHWLQPMTRQCSGGAFICAVPIGLLIRVDYLVRLLERHCQEKRIHVVDPSIYGDLPESMQHLWEQRTISFPFDMFVNSKFDREAFWAAFEFFDSLDEFEGGGGRSSYRHVQIDQVRLGMCFIGLHEAAHAVRHHVDVREVSKNWEADHRNVEIDADFNAGTWLAFARLAELRSNVGLTSPRFFETIGESCWRITYACAVILGLFDLIHHDRIHRSQNPDRPLLAMSEFGTGAYHHPTIRLMTIVNSMLNGFCSAAGTLKDEEKQLLVQMSAEGASAYMSRITAVWLKNDSTGTSRRPTSLYFPLGGGGQDGNWMHDMFAELCRDYWSFIEKYQPLLDRDDTQDAEP